MHPGALARIADALALDRTSDGPPDAARLSAAMRSALDARATATVEAILGWGLGLLAGELAPGQISAAWLGRFARFAGEAETHAQRYLWARLLALELLRPGTIHPRTLSVLDGLDDAGIGVLNRIARLSCADFIVKTDEHLLESRQLGLAEIDLAIEAGLLHHDMGRAKVFGSQQEDSFIAHVPYREKILRVTHPLPQRTLTLPVVRLTRAGADLAHANVVEEDFDYVMRITRFIRAAGYKVSHAAVAGRDADPSVIRHYGFTEIVPLSPTRR